MDIENLPDVDATQRGQTIAEVGKITKTLRSDYYIEVVKQNPLKDGVEVFIKAWHKNGIQVGFGADGTIEVERVRLFNPPLLVRDDNGPIVYTKIKEDVDSKGNTFTLPPVKYKYRDDPQEALLQVIDHVMELKKEIRDSSRIVKGKIGNTTSTFFPSVDGRTRGRDDGQTWETVHGESSGDSENDGQAQGEACSSRNVDGGGTFFIIHRGNYVFDTTAIGADSITSATFSVMGNTGNDTSPDTYDWVTTVQAPTTSTSNLDVSDYGTNGSAATNPTEGVDSGDRVDLATWVANDETYFNFPLNSAGKGWINGSGFTYFGLREGHDVTDNAPTGTNRYEADCFFSEFSGTSHDPMLVVEHGSGGGGANTNGFFMVM